MAITTSLVWTVRDVDRETSDGFIVHAAWELRGLTKNNNVGIASFRFEGDVKSVSYTHLTLPTIHLL